MIWAVLLMVLLVGLGVGFCWGMEARKLDAVLDDIVDSTGEDGTDDDPYL